MIHFALSKCDFLTVLVCCSDRENIPDTVRCSWIQKTFENNKNIEVRPFNYLESELPNTSVSSEAVSEAWANIFKVQFPDYSLLITSEPYGNFVAAFMNIQHLAFDLQKKLYPVSASAVRRDVFANWRYLPNSVKPYFSIKVVVLGTECTGKTTLSEKLAGHFNCSLVPEAARDIIADSNAFRFEDLHLVATEHAKSINKALLGNSPLVIIDTDIHTTKSYARFSFGKELEVGAAISHANRAHIYLYLNNDVPYFQDGTRLMETERNALDLSHRQVLAGANIDLIEISGNWEERFNKAVEQINKLIARKANRR